MIMTIYEHNNNTVEIKIPANTVDEIELIDITVLSGDETGKVILKNGDTIHFDASDNRLIDSYDGHYSVRGSKKIKQWLEFKFKPTRCETISYERQTIFE